MKSLIISLVVSLLYLGCSSDNQNDRQEDLTTIYLVRHAEKAGTDMDENPPLTPLGKERAEQLVKELELDTVQVLYSTDYIRTKNTLKPLAEKYNLPIKIYEAHQYQQLAKTIKENHQGETVIVVGHRDNLLPIIKALGASAPVDSIGSNEYDYIFKVTITEAGQASSTLGKFTKSFQQM